MKTNLKALTLILISGFYSASGCKQSANSSICDQTSLEEVLEESSFLQDIIQNGKTVHDFGGTYTLKMLTSKADNGNDVFYLLKYWDKTKIGNTDPIEINTQHAIYELRNCNGERIGFGSDEHALINEASLTLTTLDSKPFKH